MNKQTLAEQLAMDPRIAQAKALLLETVRDYQTKISGVKPAEEELKQRYAELIQKFEKHRGAKLWFPYLGSGFGKGALVELMDGSIKYDFICGIGPHFFGHDHAALISSGIDAAMTNTVMQGHLQQNIDSAKLTDSLIKASGFDHCFLTTSGAMANENALKVAFQKKFPAYRILAFDKCFVGRSLAISQITDKSLFREGLPPTLHVDYLPFFDAARPEESTAEAVATLKKLLVRYPKQYAAMCFELVQGEGGFYSGTKEFFIAIMTLLKDQGIAIFDDEVQSFGRLPELFAFQYFGLEKYVDIVSIGKLSQVCATLYRENFCPRPGLLSQTFTGSTSAIRAAQVMLDLLLAGRFYGPRGKIEQIQNEFIKKLTALSQKYPFLIQGPFGVGCMIAFTPLDGTAEKAHRFVRELFDAGVVSFIAGTNPTRVRFLIPAGAITFEDIDKAMEIIESTLVQQKNQD
jgi:acetylornithine/N-succinyldiaminopimelate aminotransferase